MKGCIKNIGILFVCCTMKTKKDIQYLPKLFSYCLYGVFLVKLKYDLHLIFMNLNCQNPWLCDLFCTRIYSSYSYYSRSGFYSFWNLQLNDHIRQDKKFTL